MQENPLPTAGDGGAVELDRAGADETDALISSERIRGSSVRRSNGDTIGSIEHLMIDKKGGRVVYAVMTFGGFLGLGESFYPIPWALLTYNDGFEAYEVNLSDAQLRHAPIISDMSLGNARERHRDIHDYYGVLPYWGV